MASCLYRTTPSHGFNPSYLSKICLYQKNIKPCSYHHVWHQDDVQNHEILQIYSQMHWLTSSKTISAQTSSQVCFRLQKSWISHCMFNLAFTVGWYTQLCKTLTSALPSQTLIRSSSLHTDRGLWGLQGVLWSPLLKQQRSRTIRLMLSHSLPPALWPAGPSRAAGDAVELPHMSKAPPSCLSLWTSLW